MIRGGRFGRVARLERRQREPGVAEEPQERGQEHVVAAAAAVVVREGLPLLCPIRLLLLLLLRLPLLLLLLMMMMTL